MARKHDLTGRSRNTLSPFIALERYIKASPAWQSLSLAARCAYLEFLDLYDGRNNGRIALSAKMLAARLPIGRATASRAVAELVDRGFVEVTRQGAFSVKHGDRRATEWALTRYRNDATGALPSKAFMRWQLKSKTRPHIEARTVSRESTAALSRNNIAGNVLPNETDRTPANKVTVSCRSTL